MLETRKCMVVGMILELLAINSAALNS